MGAETGPGSGGTSQRRLQPEKGAQHLPGEVPSQLAGSLSLRLSVPLSPSLLLSFPEFLGTGLQGLLDERTQARPQKSPGPCGLRPGSAWGGTGFASDTRTRCSSEDPLGPAGGVGSVQAGEQHWGWGPRVWSCRSVAPLSRTPSFFSYLELSCH